MDILNIVLAAGGLFFVLGGLELGAEFLRNRTKHQYIEIQTDISVQKIHEKNRTTLSA